jgi:hypothetical protein
MDWDIRCENVGWGGVGDEIEWEEMIWYLRYDEIRVDFM